MKEGSILEQGDRFQIMEFTQHAYTKSMLEAIPSLDQAEE